MSDNPEDTGWWMADDGRWYPPESRIGLSTTPPSPPTPTPHEERTFPRAALVGGVGAALSAIIVVGYLVLRSPDETSVPKAGPSSTTTVPPTTTAVSTTTIAPTAAVPTTPPTTAAPPQSTSAPSLADLPRDLRCADLQNMGWNYESTVGYWEGVGRPSRMDADGNGIPCETQYPSGDVAAYWSARGVTISECPSAGQLLPVLQSMPGIAAEVGSVTEIRCSGQWATASVGGDGDTAQVLLQRSSGSWIGVNVGSSGVCEGFGIDETTAAALQCAP